MAKPTSYLSAFLGHPRNLLFLAAATCVAMFASIPYGLPALEIVAVTTLGIEILAALFIPDLPSFRASVDARNRGASRLARQTLLVNQLSQRGENRALETFEHMRSRVNELYQTAGDSSTTLTTQCTSNNARPVITGACRSCLLWRTPLIQPESSERIFPRMPCTALHQPAALCSIPSGYFFSS